MAHASQLPNLRFLPCLLFGIVTSIGTGGLIASSAAEPSKILLLLQNTMPNKTYGGLVGNRGIYYVETIYRS